MSVERVGIYCDQANINASGGFNLDYSALKEFVLRGGARGVHLNIYSTVDSARNEKDPSFAGRRLGYQSAIRALGYNIRTKDTHHFEDGSVKANVDIDIAVDIMESAAKLDRVVLLSGDGDFAPLISAARRLGARVEVIAIDTCSSDLREAADAVFSGWLIPDLIPLDNAGDPRPRSWGQATSRIRGTIDNVDEENKTITIRYMKHMDNSTHAGHSAPSAPAHQGVAICDIDAIRGHEKVVVRGAIVEFTLQTSLDDLSIATDVNLHRLSTRSGWYRPLLS